MRFCHPFTLTASSHDAEQALVCHQPIGAKASIQGDQTQFLVVFPRAVFLPTIARPTWCRRNLTEIPFAHNFSKPDLEVL